MGKDLQDRIAVVTGGARGIGVAIVGRLAEQGARVAAWDIDTSPLARMDHAPAALALALDVTDAAAVETAMAATEDRLGAVDVLVNNAGVSGATVPTWDYPDDEWDRVISVDLTAVFYCSRAAARRMRVRKRGRIITIASIAGKEGNANAPAYSAAKAGVIGLCKGMAKELHGSGVLVNCIAPAMTETDLLREMNPEYIADIKSRMPMGRFCTVAEIADMTAWVASPRCSFTTGQVFDVTGGRATY